MKHERILAVTVINIDQHIGEKNLHTGAIQPCWSCVDQMREGRREGGNKGNVQVILSQSLWWPIAILKILPVY